MAKTKSKKKQSKLSNLFNTGPKKLLIFVLAFAIIGGGVYAYRSFAAEDCKVGVENKPYLVGGEVNVAGIAWCRELKATERICSYSSLQRKVGTGSWDSVDNDTDCTSSQDAVISEPHAGVASGCEQYRLYTKGWVDKGSGTSHKKDMGPKTSQVKSFHC